MFDTGSHTYYDVFYFMRNEPTCDFKIHMIEYDRYVYVYRMKIY